MATLKSVGESGLIESFRAMTRVKPSVRVGIGDDTAVLAAGKKDLLFKTDMLIEGRHFRLGQATPREIGRKAMAVNLSDIAAMGGVPTHAVVAVGLPPSLSPAFARELYRGVETTARRFGADVVGGDTNASDRLVVSVALLGEAPRGRAVTRAGAKPGDVIFVTGWLGGTYASRKHLRFTPRLAESRFLVSGFRVNAMMDLSDGLAADLRKLTAASRVGADLSYDAIPVSPNARDMRQALDEGEDFELLFTMTPREAARLTLSKKKGLAPFHPVGRITPRREGIALVRSNGKREPLRETGYEHFR
ncbi:MAG TPA: thiamine-phosphate kinase [Candidatus Eisenbacteria bacterium]|nr:thiamine-phosphate kinase [Candidatus Eisenbacteria bacterium]